MQAHFVINLGKDKFYNTTPGKGPYVDIFRFDYSQLSSQFTQKKDKTMKNFDHLVADLRDIVA